MLIFVAKPSINTIVRLINAIITLLAYRLICVRRHVARVHLGAELTNVAEHLLLPLNLLRYFSHSVLARFDGRLALQKAS